jgi:hypothetical protein
MTTPVALPQFTVQQYMEEAATPLDTTSGDPVNVEPLNILVKFTPSQSEIEVAGGTPLPFTVYLDPIIARVDTDGYLKGINSEPVYYLDPDGVTIHQVPQISSAGLPVHPVYAGTDLPAYWADDDGNDVPNPPGTVVWGVRLVQNAAMFALTNPLTYRVDYSAGDVVIKSFRFAALASDTLLDLSSVTRLDL